MKDMITSTPGTVKNMSIRDVFALSAMQGLLANGELTKAIAKDRKCTDADNRAWISETAYLFADAMIEERKNK